MWERHHRIAQLPLGQPRPIQWRCRGFHHNHFCASASATATRCDRHDRRAEFVGCTSAAVLPRAERDGNAEEEGAQRHASNQRSRHYHNRSEVTKAAVGATAVHAQLIPVPDAVPTRRRRSGQIHAGPARSVVRCLLRVHSRALVACGTGVISEARALAGTLLARSRRGAHRVLTLWARAKRAVAPKRGAVSKTTTAASNICALLPVIAVLVSAICERMQT